MLRLFCALLLVLLLPALALAQPWGFGAGPGPTPATTYPGLATSYLGQVATRTSIGMTTNGSPNNQQMIRSTHFARSNIQTFQIVLPGWYYPSAVETNLTGTTSVTASVEYPAGTITRITFSGSNSGSIASGATLISDPINVTIPNGAMFFLRIWWSNPNGIVFQNTSGSLQLPTDGWEFGTTTPDLTAGGTVGSAYAGGMYFPAAIIAQTTRPAICLMGDSRISGLYDTSADYGDIGEFARGVGPATAYLNLGLAGDQAQTFVTSYTKRVALSAYCSHILMNWGVNDIIFQGRTAAQLVANMNTIIGLFPAQKPIWVATIPPVTTSTDSWVTTTNQTTNSNNSVRVTYNTDLRTGGFVTGQTGIIDIASAVESSLNSGLWGIPSLTGDGVHELRRGALLEAPLIPVGAFTR